MCTHNCDSRGVWLSVDFMSRSVFFGVVIFMRFSDLIDCIAVVGDVLNTDLICEEFPTRAASEKKCALLYCYKNFDSCRVTLVTFSLLQPIT